MKKIDGFTLIELLAVIVILAVIALIAVPLIMNTITSSRKKAAQESVYGYLNAIELSITSYILKNQDLTVNDVNTLDGTYTCSDNALSNGDITIPVDYKGNRVDCTIKIENQKINGEFEANGFKFSYDGNNLLALD